MNISYTDKIKPKKNIFRGFLSIITLRFIRDKITYKKIMKNADTIPKEVTPESIDYNVLKK